LWVKKQEEIPQKEWLGLLQPLEICLTPVVFPDFLAARASKERFGVDLLAECRAFVVCQRVGPDG